MAETLELLVRIGADVTALKKGVQAAGKDVQALERTTQDAGKGMDTAVAQAARALQSSIQRSVSNSARNLVTLAAGFVTVQTAVTAFTGAVDEAAALGRLAQQTGIGVEALSQLRFAVGSVGVDFETFQQLVMGFSQRLAEGLGQPLSAVSLALRDMGISMRDARGRTREFMDVLPELADWFARTSDGLAKTQRAVALFGEEAGPRLLPLLNEGSAGIQRLMRRAQELGVTLTADAARQAREFQRTMFEAGEALRPLVRDLAAQLTPVLRDLIAFFVTVAQRWGAQAREVRGTAEGLNDTIRQHRVWEAQLQQQIATLERLPGPLTPGQLADLNVWREQLRITQGLISELLAAIRDLGVAPPPLPPLGAPPGGDARTMSDLTRDAQAGLQEAQANLALFNDLVFGTRSAVLTLGEAWSQTARGIAGWAGQLNLSFVSYAEIMQQARARVVGAYQTEAEQQRALVTFELALNKARQQGMFDTANAAASLITQLWPQQKNAAVAAGVINTAVGVSRAISSGIPPWNLAQAAITAAAGAAQIASFRASNPGGGASPSSPAVSAPAPADVASAGGGGAPGASAAPEAAMFSFGFNRDHLYSGAQVLGVIDHVNAELRRGTVTFRLADGPAKTSH